MSISADLRGVNALTIKTNKLNVMKTPTEAEDLSSDSSAEEVEVDMAASGRGVFAFYGATEKYLMKLGVKS